MEHDFPRIGRRVMMLNARRIPGENHRPDLILLAFEDMHDTSGDQETR
jgi:two-component system CheB/CheR fusion protein